MIGWLRDVTAACLALVAIALGTAADLVMDLSDRAGGTR